MRTKEMEEHQDKVARMYAKDGDKFGLHAIGLMENAKPTGVEREMAALISAMMILRSVLPGDVAAGAILSLGHPLMEFCVEVSVEAKAVLKAKGMAI